MGKHDHILESAFFQTDLAPVSETDSVMAYALVAIANELAELNEFFKASGMKKDEFDKSIRGWLGG